MAIDRSVDLRLRYKQTEGDVLVSGIVASVNESISNILNTRQGSRLFNRGFGTGLSSLLFEPMGELTGSLLLLAIDQAISKYEPRVQISFNDSEVIPDYDNNGYLIRITYQILGRQEVGEFDTFLSSELR